MPGTKGTPEPWEQAKEIRNRCPGSSHKQARKALDHCHGDIEKAVLYLKSELEATHTCLQNVDNETQKNKDTLSCLKLPTVFQRISLQHESLHSSTFNLWGLIGAIQSGDSMGQVYQYLAYHHATDRKELEACINRNVKDFPAIFYVVAANDRELIRRWVKYGGKLDAIHAASGLPLIAFAILFASQIRHRATDMLRELLILGADPKVIPATFYQPFNRELPKSGPAEADMNDIHEEDKLWCEPSFRPLLVAALGLTERYLLNRAVRLQPPSGRKLILARRKNAEALLGINFLVIGQEMAVDSLKRSLLNHLAMTKAEPLVLLFAGPSGHGKTELARKFGELMSLEHQFVDCTMFTREEELFGPKPPYSGYDTGSPLNNFLARMSGSKSIVFMDEFEKTTTGVRNTLLIPFDQGEYVDRRSASKINCSQTIWILATNIFDPTIHKFCVGNKRELLESANKPKPRLFEKLVGFLRKECLSHFGAPLAGRISEIVPFLTFSPDEAAVVVHKKIMELEVELARPIQLSLTKEGENLVGNVELDVARDSMVCSHLAEKYYVPELGARGIFRGVKRAIEERVVDQYLEEGEDFSENQPVTRFTVDVNEEQEVEVLLVPRED